MTSDKPQQNPYLKIAIEMGPLIVFFGTYFLAPRFGAEEPIFLATGIFMAAMTVAIIASWKIAREVPPMLWVSFTVVVVMGGLTIILHDDTFIKMKPTIVNSIFAITLLGGLATGRALMKPLFKAAFPPITDQGWKLLTRNWAFFFLFLAVLNEVIWRNFSEEFWVTFKVWGNMPITFVFAASQLKVMNAHLFKKDHEETPQVEAAE